MSDKPDHIRMSTDEASIKWPRIDRIAARIATSMPRIAKFRANFDNIKLNDNGLYVELLGNFDYGKFETSMKSEISNLDEISKYISDQMLSEDGKRENKELFEEKGLDVDSIDHSEYRIFQNEKTGHFYLFLPMDRLSSGLKEENIQKGKDDYNNKLKDVDDSEDESKKGKPKIVNEIISSMREYVSKAAGGKPIISTKENTSSVKHPSNNSSWTKTSYSILWADKPAKVKSSNSNISWEISFHMQVNKNIPSLTPNLSLAIKSNNSLIYNKESVDQEFKAKDYANPDKKSIHIILVIKSEKNEIELDCPEKCADNMCKDMMKFLNEIIDDFEKDLQQEIKNESLETDKNQA